MWLGRLILLITLLICFCPVHGQKQIRQPVQKNLKGQTFSARVIRIIDGDSMEVLYEGQPLKIRLSHIDSPELKKSQPYGKAAKKALSDLCYGQYVTVQVEKYDRYGRAIALVVNANKQIINQQMIIQGMAWHFKRYSKDPLYARLEREARKNRAGLWKDPDAVAPWEWRSVRRYSSGRIKSYSGRFN
ncbi:thermonuclease family protein [Sphingobacterium spiritivorum]|uniref:thermonuclease family protein n=1 Tax=Sphingobacterium spiritivorum TaxID=258 RepID=UPI003DA1E96A